MLTDIQTNMQTTMQTNVLTENENLASARLRNIRNALEEDIGRVDLTAQLIGEKTSVKAQLIVRQSAILCGTDWFEGCVTQLDPNAMMTWHCPEGGLLTADQVVCTINANARSLLTAERSAINFLQTLSATATQTHHFVKTIQGVSPNPNGCAILDTRKTLPGLRQAQKYAVRTGGGANQRMALWDGILIKENHIMAAGGIANALQAAQQLKAGVSIQIEVENLEELRQALAAGADNILLDNFSIHDLHAAVKLTFGRAILEASGGINLQTIASVAATGVDRISIGSLTKDIHAVDFSLRLFT